MAGVSARTRQQSGKPSKKWLRIAAMYRRFAKDYPHADFSDAAAAAMYAAESHGASISDTGGQNGFAIGKKWMDVTLAMWREDIQAGLLSVSELLDDGYPEWFLNRVGILALMPNKPRKATAVQDAQEVVLADGE